MDAQADLCLCYSHATKSGYLTLRLKHSSSFTLKTAVHKQLRPLIYCCKQGYYLYLIRQRCFPLEPLLELDGSTYIPSSQTCHSPSKERQTSTLNHRFRCKIFQRKIVNIFLPISFLFDLILYVPSTIFQLNRDGSSWIEPVVS